MAFGFLKRLFGKSDNVSSKKSNELGAIMAQLQKQIFPDGKQQMNSEINDLASKLGVSASRISGTFTYACSRVWLGNCDRQTLLIGIKRHDPNLSDKQVNDFAKFIFKKQLRQATGIDNDSILEMSLSSYGFIDGPKYDVIPGGYGEFGLELTNPVPVNGVPSNETYLKRLVTSDGLEIKWERRGSFGAQNIKDPIDCYKITDENGFTHPDIYISPYHASTSNKAPKGYKFR